MPYIYKFLATVSLNIGNGKFVQCHYHGCLLRNKLKNGGIC